MRLRVALPFAAALLLASSASAFADSTYAIATTTSLLGTISGTITGTGDTLTSFDLTAVNGANTYTFDSSIAGDTGTFSLVPGITLPDGTPIYSIGINDSAAAILFLGVVGDFTSGLTPVEAGQAVYFNGSPSSTTGSGAIVENFTQTTTLTEDDVSLTLQPTVATTPEPASWLLLATGLAGLCGIAINRR